MDGIRWCWGSSRDSLKCWFTQLPWKMVPGTYYDLSAGVKKNRVPRMSVPGPIELCGKILQWILQHIWDLTLLRVCLRKRDSLLWGTGKLPTLVLRSVLWWGADICVLVKISHFSEWFGFGGGHSNMKVTYNMCLPENENRGAFGVRFLWKKKGHSVWAQKYGIFFDVDSPKWGHLVCKNAILSQNLPILCSNSRKIGKFLKMRTKFFNLFVKFDTKVEKGGHWV